MAQRAPKQRQLTKDETITSFENWRQNLVYILSLDNNFTSFLESDSTWLKKSTANPNRGLTADVDPVPEAQRKTAVQKNAQLELMLGQIANYAAVISRNSILKQSTSLQAIWQKLREHYGFQSTGSHFLDLCTIRLQPDEKHEDLYQRIMAFFEDSLLTANSSVKHHNDTFPTDEEMSPTLENTVTVLWLQLIHPSLPQLVKQKYGADLRNKTVSSIKSEISQALPSLLDELNSIEDSKAMRTFSSFTTKKPPFRNKQSTKSCILCKSAGRPHTSHFLSGCKFLPDRDRQALGRSRLVVDCDEDEPEDTSYNSDPENDGEGSALLDKPSARRVGVVQSPVLNTYFKSHLVRLTLDTGATTNMIKVSVAKYIGLPISNASQMARQADGVTPMNVLGEVHCELTRGSHSFAFDALVVDQLDVDVLAGTPFLTQNDIATRPAKRQIVINGSDIAYYGSQQSKMATARRAQCFLLRSPPQQTILLPGDYVELATPYAAKPDIAWALEPRLDNPLNRGLEPTKAWPVPQEVQAVDNTIRLSNSTSEPILLRRGEHLCQVRPISSVEAPTKLDAAPKNHPITPIPTKPYSAAASLDPDNILGQDIYDKFAQVNRTYDEVFNPAISRYNGKSGNIEAIVNIGPTLPPQRKGRLPQYNKDSLVELQQKFDELESAGVFAKPEEVGIVIEYLNISFLVKKPSGGSRLVTSFGEVASYSKPQPSLMPSVDQVLRDIACWKYVIVTDLLQSFYQIPLAKASMKYCGVATPFKGVRVYTRCAMGMPGSETCLEELMSRVLGDLIQEGCVVKLADDLYCGGDTVEEALSSWSRLLHALHENNLHLSARKTVICPRSTVILGWIWSNGTLKASPHRIASLSSVEPPASIQGLRSFIGAYKVLSRVLPTYANLLHPLDQTAAGQKSHEKVIWTDSLLLDFHKAQKALLDSRVIHLPRPKDTIWLVTDGSVKCHGIGATMYILRDDDLLLAGFFNAKLRQHQITWLPCEIEALCIGAAIRHFSPYIIQSSQRCQVLTDSRPCVQAYDKLLRGEFSSSSRVTTFLSTLSRYQIQVQHISGAANLPSDFASRHPQSCLNQSCQICKFIEEIEDSVVRSLSVKDIMDGNAKMPFTSRVAWLSTQQDCPDLRRSHAHLSQGTRPSKKATKIPDVKRYLQVGRLARDGMLIVQEDLPFSRMRERIIVPRSVLHGLLLALHFRFSHPSRHQMKLLFNRYFYALDAEKGIDSITSSCSHCCAVSTIPKHLQPQSTSAPPEAIGVNFAVDIMRRYRQYILVLRETVSSLTLTALVDDEKHTTLRDTLITLCSQLCCRADGGIHIRTDSAPGFIALKSDNILLSQGIHLVLGHVKNVNKNPVAERAVEELGLELLHLSPEGGPISKVTLAMATASMNSRLRYSGLSAQEVWTQRDQVTGEQLPLSDRDLINQQNQQRLLNHPHSATAKCHGKVQKNKNVITIGDLVYIKGEGDKTRARDKYLVTSVSEPWCQLRKFTKSQFRSKVYDVKLSNCYLVSPTILAQSPTGPIRGLEPPDTTEEPEDEDIACDLTPHSLGLTDDKLPLPDTPSQYDTIPALPTAPDAIVRPPDQPSAELDQQDDLNLTVAVDDSMSTEQMTEDDGMHNVVNDLRRSSRPRRAPPWMTSNSWIMEE